jgi:AraC-like DNA-binding protein
MRAPNTQNGGANTGQRGAQAWKINRIGAHIGDRLDETLASRRCLIVLHRLRGRFGLDQKMRASNDPRRAAVADILRLLRNEVETADFGNQIVARHLLSTLFVYVLREWVDAASPLADNWFSALRSPHIARALACIHEAPANDWTLDALAEAAGLSRSAFAAQFRTSVGEPPHNYLIRWRMGIAAHTGLRLAEIAARVGNKSEFAFSRAFARARGLSPARFRNRANSTS